MNKTTFDNVTHEFLAAFMEKYYRAWDIRSGEDVAKLCTEDVVWIDPSVPTALNGRDDVAQFVDSLFLGFPDARFSEEGDAAISRDGQTTFAPYRMTGTNSGPFEAAGIAAATGKAIAVLGVDTYRFRGGLIAQYRTYLDKLDVMRQLGLAPEA